MEQKDIIAEGEPANREPSFEEILKMRPARSRMGGVLVHPTSFPSPFGIGDLGRGAYDFIDFLAETKQHLWQVLPLGPTGFGDSPYQSLSAFAGQIYIISPEKLLEDGLLTEADFQDMPAWDPRRVDYGSAIEFKVSLLKKAFGNFEKETESKLRKPFAEFIAKEKDWLEDYALFMAVKDYHKGQAWLDWEDEIRDAKTFAKIEYSWMLKDQIRFYQFTQFLFDLQWHELRLYAAKKDIWIIGDIPIFMALDNADVWSDKELFKLDPTGHPLEVAGVPPDYFSATGQLWGNPLYDWDCHEKTGYSWWIRRIRRQLELVDYVRIDHFRGFESYWSVPAGEKTAINGAWLPGPGAKLFRAFQKEFGETLPIIAEDLGIITPEVEALRDEFHFPGMKVLQFGFGDMNDRQYIPHFYNTANCVCYTGTHDNETTVGWYGHQAEEVKDRIRCIGNCDGGGVSLDFIRFAYSSVAKWALFPIQDLLQLGNEARMNTPGVAAANWAFRYEQGQLSEGWRRDWLRKYTEVFGR